MMTRSFLRLVALGALATTMLGGCTQGLSDAKAQSVECPSVLTMQSPDVDTSGGKFTLERVEVWITPDCLGTPQDVPIWRVDQNGDLQREQSAGNEGPRAPGYLVIYTWTNTTGAPVQMGYAETPLHISLGRDGSSEAFPPPIIPQALQPYEVVAPGDSVTVEQWRSAWQGKPEVPNEIYVFNDDRSVDVGPLKLSPER